MQGAHWIPGNMVLRFFIPCCSPRADSYSIPKQAQTLLLVPVWHLPTRPPVQSWLYFKSFFVFLRVGWNTSCEEPSDVCSFPGELLWLLHFLAQNKLPSVLFGYFSVLTSGYTLHSSVPLCPRSWVGSTVSVSSWVGQWGVADDWRGLTPILSAWGSHPPWRPWFLWGALCYGCSSLWVPEASLSISPLARL